MLHLLNSLQENDDQYFFECGRAPGWGSDAVGRGKAADAGDGARLSESLRESEEDQGDDWKVEQTHCKHG